MRTGCTPRTPRKTQTPRSSRQITVEEAGGAQPSPTVRRGAQRAGDDEKRPVQSLDSGHQRPQAWQSDSRPRGRSTSGRSSVPSDPLPDGRHHLRSLLMRESLLDREVMRATEAPTVAMLPFCHVVKVGGRSILDGGRQSTYPLVEAIGEALGRQQADPRDRWAASGPGTSSRSGSTSTADWGAGAAGPGLTRWATRTCSGRCSRPTG